MRTVIALLAFAISTSALAGGIKNKDPREYRIVMKTDKDEVSKLINPSTNSQLVSEKHCAAFPCIVENKDTGEKVKLLHAEESVEISGGKFSVR